MDHHLTQKIQDDFDRIAQAEQETYTQQKWDHNNHYHDFLLRQLPTPCGTVLDIGCGTGEFVHRLAQQADCVTAIDLSPNMIEVAKQRFCDVDDVENNVEFHVADIMTWALPPEQFDAIVSISTLHHVPLEPLLAKLEAALKPGGRLVILDLMQNATVWDAACDLVAIPLNWLYERRWNRGVKPSREAEIAMQTHMETDEYLTLAEARRIYMGALAGVKVRKQLFWRYSAVWEKKKKR